MTNEERSEAMVEGWRTSNFRRVDFDERMESVPYSTRRVFEVVCESCGIIGTVDDPEDTAAIQAVIGAHSHQVPDGG